MKRRVCILRMGWQPFIDSPLWNLIDALDARDIQVTLLKSVARKDLGKGEEIHPRADCRLVPLFFKQFTKTPLLRPFFQMLTLLELWARFAWSGIQARPGVVIGIDVDMLPAAWLIARICRARLIFYSYELYTDRPGIPMKPFWNWLERRFIKRPDLVVACEPNRSLELKRRYGLRECPMTVLNVPPRAQARPRSDRIQQFLKEQGLPSGKVLYFHGWISRARCADAFVKALPSVREDAVLFFIGPCEPAFKDELQRMARELGVERRVVFHPMVSSQELMDLAASADIGLQAQLNVGLNSYYCAPIKLFQYMSVGLPVIGSNFPGMLEIIEKNEVGLCVNPESVEEIAAAMNRLVEDDAMRARMAENALRLARDRYCYEVEGKTLVDAIDDMLRK